MQALFQLVGVNSWAMIGAIAILVILLAAAIKILSEWERGVVLRLGRFGGVRGPGLLFIIPIIDRLYKVPLRTIVFDVPEQEVITLDNVSCKVNAVLYYRVVEPSKAMVNVERYHEATIQLAQTTLRSVAGQAQFDELLSERDKLNRQLQQIIDEATDPWGIKVSWGEIKDVEIPADMQQAIARQAVAERDRRAIIIQAEGEKEASERISQAASILSKQPGGMTLRSFRTASEVSAKQTSTIIFPLPLELGELMSTLKQNKAQSDNT